MGLESEVNASTEVVEEGETDPGQVEGSGWEQGLLGDVQIPEVPLPVLVAVGIGFITLLLFVILSRRRSKGKQNSIVIMGPVKAGKTTLYLQLKEGSTMNGTVSSMEQNEDTFVPHLGLESDKPVHFVDLPGHPRLVDKLEDHIYSAAGVIFVVDSTDFIPYTRDIAEQLYGLLSHHEFYARRIPLMIACNKVDLGAKAHTEHFIEKRIQKEIDSIRSTRASLDGETAGAPVGKPDSPFTFQDLRSKVGMAKISAKNGGDDVKPVYDFVSLCMKRM